MRWKGGERGESEGNEIEPENDEDEAYPAWAGTLITYLEWSHLYKYTSLCPGYLHTFTIHITKTKKWIEGWVFT